MLIILAVIFMVGGRHKNRAQIQDLHFKTLEIVQFIQDPLKIPAVEPVHIQNRQPFLPVFHLADRKPDINILIGDDIIGRIAVAEPVHKDLIHHRALRPFRHMKPRRDLKHALAFQIVRQAKAGIGTDLIPAYNLKIKKNGGVPHGEHRLVIIKSPG